MIKSKKELKEYLLQDAKATNHKSIRPKLFQDEVWAFQVLMRKCSYYKYKSKKSPLYTIPFLFCRWRYQRLSVKLGFTIYHSSFGKGLSIAHMGTIVVSSKTVVGENCRIHTCVNIGVSGDSKAPQIGNNVYIGPGVKIVGDITIADGVCLGAGAVVVKSITEPNTTWAGVPARKISDKSAHHMLNPKLFEDSEGE